MSNRVVFVKRLIGHSQMTNKEIAELVGVSTMSVHRWRLGLTKRIRLNNFLSLRHHLENSDDMVLRDYFAGQALAGNLRYLGEDSLPEMTKTAYKIADAMLEERSK
jgi:DNA-binding Xre family transcriptional regulator